MKMRMKFLVVVACSFCFTIGASEGNANSIPDTQSAETHLDASLNKKEKPKKGKKKLRKKKKIRKVWW